MPQAFLTHIRTSVRSANFMANLSPMSSSRRAPRYRWRHPRRTEGGRPPSNPLAESLGRFYEGERSQTEDNHVSQTKQDDQRRRNSVVSEGDGSDALIW